MTLDTMLLVFGAVAVGVLGQAWTSYLEHRRRLQALDVIKAALQAGKDPPAELYALLKKDGAAHSPYGEVFMFGVLALGFWLAVAVLDGERRAAFFVVAVSMTVAALGTLALALKSGRARNDDKP